MHAAMRLQQPQRYYASVFGSCAERWASCSAMRAIDDKAREDASQR